MTKQTAGTLDHSAEGRVRWRQKATVYNRVTLLNGAHREQAVGEVTDLDEAIMFAVRGPTRRLDGLVIKLADGSREYTGRTIRQLFDQLASL